MSSNIGEALLKIIVDVKTGASEQKLLSFFNNLTQMAAGATAALTGATGAANNAGTAFTAAATGARTLAQNVTLLNAALNGTAAAAGAGAAGASKNINGVAAAIQRGIDIARLGEAANRKYAKSMQDLAQPWARGMLTTRESRRGSMNLEKERRGDTFSEALSRSQLKTDPVREHFTKRADELSKKVVSGALSAEQAIARYNKEVRKIGVQGVFTQQGQKLKTLTIMTDRLTAAQEKYNAAQRAKAIEKGIALADPRQAATKLASNISNIQAAAGAGAISSKQAASEIAKLNSEFRKTYSSMGMFEAKMEGIAFKTSMFSSSLRTAGRQLMMFAGVIAAAITPAVVANAKFEQAVQNVAAVLDGIGDKTVIVRQLSAQFLDLGERSEFTAIQVAEAAKELAKAGFTAREVKGSLEGVVNLASAAGVSLAEAAEVAANLTRAFQLPAESFGSVADKLTAMANTSTADVKDLASAFKYVSPIAAAFGQSIDDVGAALVVLANTGSKGSRAGTGLSRFFSELVEPRKVAKLKVLLESVGESVDQLTPDENGLREMIALLDRLKSTKKIKDADLSGIFDQRSARAVLALLSQGIEEFDKAKDFIENRSAGLAQATRDARLESLMGDWLKFTSALNSAFIKAGGTVNNFIRDGLQYATHWVQQFSKSMEGSSGSFIKTVANIAALATAFGLAASAAGSLVAVFGAVAMSISVLGGPITLAIAGLSVLIGLLAKNFIDAQVNAAGQMRAAVKSLEDRFKTVTTDLREANKELDEMRNKLGLLRRLPELNPLQISELFKNGDPFDTSVLRARRKNQVDNFKLLLDEQSKLAEKASKSQTEFGGKSFFRSGIFSIPGILEGFEVDSTTAVLRAQIDALDLKMKSIKDVVSNIDEITKSIEDSARISSLGYTESLVELEAVNKKLKEQEQLVFDLEVAAKTDTSLEAKLGVQQTYLESLKATKEQLLAQTTTSLEVLAATQKIGKAELELTKLRKEGAPTAVIEAREAALKSYTKELANVRAEYEASRKAAEALSEAVSELEEKEKKRAESKMSDVEKKLAEMQEEGQAELEAVNQVLAGQVAALETARTDMQKAVLELEAAKQKGATGEDIAKAEAKVQSETENVEAQEAVVDKTRQKAKELPLILAGEQSDFATKSQQEQADKVADMMQKAALAVAQKNHNMAEEIRLTKEIAERERDRNREALKADKAGPQEIAAFENAETARIAQEVADIQEKYTTQYLEDIDKVNLEIAKKTNNLKEELRLTEKLRQAEIAKKALEVDPAIRQQWIDAQQQQLQTELDDTRRNAGDKSPVKNQLSQIENRSDDLLKKRVENQDKIRDALAQQVKTLYDAQMLNNYLFKVERARESWKEQARTKALADAKRLQGMADRGGNSWAIASQFSKAAASLDTARASGVSNLALSPAANVISGIPMNIPVQPVRAAAGGGGTSINSNNNTLTIEKGAIVINGASDSEKVAAVVVDTIKDMFSGKGPKRGK